MKTIDKDLAKVTKKEQEKSRGLKKTWRQPGFIELKVNETMTGTPGDSGEGLGYTPPSS